MLFTFRFGNVSKQLSFFFFFFFFFVSEIFQSFNLTNLQREGLDSSGEGFAALAR
ncbi:hypothetical protein HYPBUDRAFT_171025 [Hyphopichia burtonii NRRL Y-1933]|uniref:Uncharacterized protein n=1 Tax=Hyphopichia burtonii NRRL Y-1933 TaxID=984485 RepID=A0A1E4RQA0_9ASCO|nr:hypothetical protein HYPBUDRAFT_171025 [Hyphopichia burtonii NRRL Y-1933]ODV69464.1 hypothetical protein HYPBUDRAFT_171025 [Hyphopichia burtonii NRRL Y-1933]